jgi:D-alanyl-D-alanine carboxypeptidase
VTCSDPARTAVRGARSTILAALVAVGTVLTGVLVYPSLAPSSSPVVPAPSSSSAASAPDVLRNHHRGPRRELRDALGETDGAVPDGTTVFDHDHPGVVNLDPALLGALRRAATDAANDGIELVVNSGWRSPEYQERLLREAVSEYGSEEEAARWVAGPRTSPHVSGDAVDIGPVAATAWLSEDGARYGLCQIYGNEAWHYELRPEAIHDGCPPMYLDPTHDPRMQR